MYWRCCIEPVSLISHHHCVFLPWASIVTVAIRSREQALAMWSQGEAVVARFGILVSNEEVA